MKIMELNFLAFDFGSSSGRMILGKYNGKKIVLEEIFRFYDGTKFINNHYYWDILKLYDQLIFGIKKANEITGNNITSLGIDTCGVDYGLLDRNNNLMGHPYFYRDHRTNNLMNELLDITSKEEIYKETGIQFMHCNTLVQLYSDLKSRPWILENAKSLLFIPDLLNFYLTGKKYSENTIASTSQFYNPVEEKWASNLLKKLKLPLHILQHIIYPCHEIGDLLQSIKEECSIKGKLPVIAVGSHDTASAIAGTPLDNRKNSVYISSGSWSLLGMELISPIINQLSMKDNFTNEIGLEKTIRFLTNISGLWLLHQCKKIWDKQGLEVSFKKMSESAAKAKPGQFKININDEAFLNPPDAIEAINDYCRRTDQDIPKNYPTITRGIYEDLANKYKFYVEELERIVGVKIKNINMVGGGSQSETLCQLVANTTDKKVVAGPVSATAIGNIIAQLLARGEIANLDEGREIIRKSFDLKQYKCLV